MGCLLGGGYPRAYQHMNYTSKACDVTHVDDVTMQCTLYHALTFVQWYLCFQHDYVSEKQLYSGEY